MDGRVDVVTPGDRLTRWAGWGVRGSTVGEKARDGKRV